MDTFERLAAEAVRLARCVGVTRDRANVRRAGQLLMLDVTSAPLVVSSCARACCTPLLAARSWHAAVLAMCSASSDGIGATHERATSLSPTAVPSPPPRWPIDPPLSRPHPPTALPPLQLQQEVDADVPRDPDGRAPAAAWRARQARRVGGHQGGDQVHVRVRVGALAHRGGRVTRRRGRRRSREGRVRWAAAATASQVPPCASRAQRLVACARTSNNTRGGARTTRQQQQLHTHIHTTPDMAGSQH